MSQFIFSGVFVRTFEELVEKYTRFGYRGDGLWKRIIERSIISRDFVGELYKIPTRTGG